MTPPKKRKVPFWNKDDEVVEHHLYISVEALKELIENNCRKEYYYGANIIDVDELLNFINKE